MEILYHPGRNNKKRIRGPVKGKFLMRMTYPHFPQYAVDKVDNPSAYKDPLLITRQEPQPPSRPIVDNFCIE